MKSIPPYAIPENRELRDDEWDLIRTMLSLKNTMPFEDISNYKVIGRCGCGVCPTIFIGQEGDFDKIKGFKEILVDTIGTTENGHSVYATLFRHNAAAIQFEINYYTGEGEYRLPIPSSLQIIK